MISYQYPVAYFYGDDFGDREVHYRSGRISPINLTKVPFEATVHAEGSSFHVIFGYQCNGMFLCIPNWHTGCELANLQDLSWNLNALLDNEQSLSYEDASAVVYALHELDQYIQ